MLKQRRVADDLVPSASEGNATEISKNDALREAQPEGTQKICMCLGTVKMEGIEDKDSVRGNDSDDVEDGDDADDGDAESIDPELTEEQTEEWEAELDEDMQDPTAEGKSWSELMKEIRVHLHKHLMMLPISQLNKYMILGNFFTLCHKGHGHIQASIEIAHHWHLNDSGTFSSLCLHSCSPLQDIWKAAKGNPWRHTEVKVMVSQ